MAQRGITAITVTRMEHKTPYAWRVGDVFTNGTFRWKVDSGPRREGGHMRSCGSEWATTIPLTFSEWREGGRWYLEREATYCPRRASGEFVRGGRQAAGSY